MTTTDRGRDDGGAAFPTESYETPLPNGAKFRVAGSRGMSLRDWYAGQAMAHMGRINTWTDNPLYWEGIARGAYACADALLAERTKP